MYSEREQKKVEKTGMHTVHGGRGWEEGWWLESRERRRRKLCVGKQRDRATVSNLSGELGQHPQREK